MKNEQIACGHQTPVWLGILIVLGWLVMPTAPAADLDRAELANLGLQPAYVSPSQIRAGSGLRAVAFAPPDPHAPPPIASVALNSNQVSAGSVGVAVGDAGTILRSEDGGETWQLIENVVLAESSSGGDPNQPTRRALDFFGTANRTRQSAAARVAPLPFCEFSDVLWGSPRDVIVVGGGYEPVTGISRGVCLYSHDAGRTWQSADAHELPRMRNLQLAPQAVLLATGDASEASGANRFASYNGGRSWVEDMLPTSSAKPTPSRPPTRTIDTPQGSVTIADVCRTPDGGEVAVASHGRIFLRTVDDPAWRAVRGANRQPAVLFIAASPAEVPWSLVGRETLHEHVRVAVLIDGQTLDDKPLDRCRAAAAMLGSGEIEQIGSTVSRQQWLRQRRPAVVVLDDSLSPAVREAWLETIEHTRTRPSATTEGLTGRAADGLADDRWGGPQRIVLSRRVGVNAYPGWNMASWQRAWNHGSELRCNALLTGPGVLASDLSLDASLVIAPAFPLASGVEVATLEDVSGSVRRDISLAAGVQLHPGQTRDEMQSDSASHRRLQITTSRMNQTTRLLAELRDANLASASADEIGRLTREVEQLLAGMAAEDRTRLLWETFLQIKRERTHSLPLRAMLLGLLARHAEPESIRRWSSLAAETDAKSVELRMRSPLVRLTSRASHVAEPIANELSASHVTPASAPQNVRPEIGKSQPVSPFQIRPVSYEKESPAGPPILVPAAPVTHWQSTRGLSRLSLPTPNDSAAGLSTSSADSPTQTKTLARINWDYHPVVMGARGIALGDGQATSSLASRETTGDARPDNAITYHPPTTGLRPLIDGDVSDACWQAADLWRSKWLVSRCVADEDYLYIAISAGRGEGVRLMLDCDGDYLTSLQFELSRDGSAEAFVPGIGSVHPVWYSAVNTRPGESDAEHWISEIAIARSSLPAAVCQIRSSLTEDADLQWQVMPEPEQWHPSRQSLSGR